VIDMMRQCGVLLLVAVCGWLSGAPPAVAYVSTLPLYSEIVGGVITHTVQPGETLMAIDGRLGVQWQAMATINSLSNPDRIYPGQRVHADTARIVPALLDDGIVINIPEATLYYFERGRLMFQTGVGLGRPKAWETVTGQFTIVTKQQHPTWVVPTSIQHEMESEGRVIVQRLPPGPDNPLGAFWLGLSFAGFGIHGTIEPSSIGQYRSHGCIRMHLEDIRASSLL
jgi:L,D-transpeptidase ErfK/SrfK